MADLFQDMFEECDDGDLPGRTEDHHGSRGGGGHLPYSHDEGGNGDDGNVSSGEEELDRYSQEGPSWSDGGEVEMRASGVVKGGVRAGGSRGPRGLLGRGGRTPATITPSTRRSHDTMVARGRSRGGPTPRSGMGPGVFPTTINAFSTAREARSVLMRAHSGVMAVNGDKRRWSGGQLTVSVPKPSRSSGHRVGGGNDAYSSNREFLYIQPETLLLVNADGDIGFIHLQRRILKHHTLWGYGDQRERQNNAATAYQMIADEFHEALVKCLHEDHPMYNRISEGYLSRNTAHNTTLANSMAAAWVMVLESCATRRKATTDEVRAFMVVQLKGLFAGKGCCPEVFVVNYRQHIGLKEDLADSSMGERRGEGNPFTPNVDPFSMVPPTSDNRTPLAVHDISVTDETMVQGIHVDLAMRLADLVDHIIGNGTILTQTLRAIVAEVQRPVRDHVDTYARGRRRVEAAGMSQQNSGGLRIRDLDLGPFSGDDRRGRSNDGNRTWSTHASASHHDGSRRRDHDSDRSSETSSSSDSMYSRTSRRSRRSRRKSKRHHRRRHHSEVHEENRHHRRSAGRRDDLDVERPQASGIGRVKRLHPGSTVWTKGVVDHLQRGGTIASSPAPYEDMRNVVEHLRKNPHIRDPMNLVALFDRALQADQLEAEGGDYAGMYGVRADEEEASYAEQSGDAGSVDLGSQDGEEGYPTRSERIDGLVRSSNGHLGETRLSTTQRRGARGDHSGTNDSFRSGATGHSSQSDSTRASWHHGMRENAVSSDLEQAFANDTGEASTVSRSPVMSLSPNTEATTVIRGNVRESGSMQPRIDLGTTLAMDSGAVQTPMIGDNPELLPIPPMSATEYQATRDKVVGQLAIAESDYARHLVASQQLAVALQEATSRAAACRKTLEEAQAVAIQHVHQQSQQSHASRDQVRLSPPLPPNRVAPSAVPSKGGIAPVLSPGDVVRAAEMAVRTTTAAHSDLEVRTRDEIRRTGAALEVYHRLSDQLRVISLIRVSATLEDTPQHGDTGPTLGATNLPSRQRARRVEGGMRSGATTPPTDGEGERARNRRIQPTMVADGTRQGNLLEENKETSLDQEAKLGGNTLSGRGRMGRHSPISTSRLTCNDRICVRYHREYGYPPHCRNPDCTDEQGEPWDDCCNGRHSHYESNPHRTPAGAPGDAAGARGDPGGHRHVPLSGISQMRGDNGGHRQGGVGSASVRGPQYPDRGGDDRRYERQRDRRGGGNAPDGRGVLDDIGTHEREDERARERAEARRQAGRTYHPDTCSRIFHAVLELLSGLHDRYEELQRVGTHGSNTREREHRQLDTLFKYGCGSLRAAREPRRTPRPSHMNRISDVDESTTAVRRIDTTTSIDAKGTYTHCRSVNNVPHNYIDDMAWTSRGNWAHHSQCADTETDCRGCFACNATEHHNHTSECERGAEYDRKTHQICYRCNKVVSLTSGHDASNCKDTAKCVDWELLGSEGGCDGKHASYDCPIRLNAAAARRALREKGTSSAGGSSRKDKDDKSGGGGRGGGGADNAPDRDRGVKGKGKKKGNESGGKQDQHRKGGKAAGGNAELEAGPSTGEGEGEKGVSQLRQVEGEPINQDASGNRPGEEDETKGEEVTDGSDLIKVSTTGVKDDVRGPKAASMTGQWDNNMRKVGEDNADKAGEETRGAGRRHAANQARKTNNDPKSGLNETKTQSMKEANEGGEYKERETEGVLHLKSQLPVPAIERGDNRSVNDSKIQEGDLKALANVYMAKSRGFQPGTSPYRHHSENKQPTHLEATDDLNSVNMRSTAIDAETGHYRYDEKDEAIEGTRRAEERNSDHKVELIKLDRMRSPDENMAIDKIEEKVGNSKGCRTVDLKGDSEEFVDLLESLDEPATSPPEGKSPMSVPPEAVSLSQYLSDVGRATPLQEHEQDWEELTITFMDQYETVLSNRYSYEGAEGLETLMTGGKMWALTIDSGAERNHCSRGHPCLKDIKKMKRAMVAITANGGRTRIEEFGQIRGHVYDGEGKAQWVNFRCLITEGMGPLDVLISTSSLSEFVGQFRAGSDLDHLPSVCQIGIEDGTLATGRVEDALVMRRFPVFRVHKDGIPNDPRKRGGSYIIPMAQESPVKPLRKSFSTSESLTVHEVKALKDGCFEQYRCQQDEVLKLCKKSLGIEWTEILKELLATRSTVPQPSTDAMSLEESSEQKEEDNRVEDLEFRDQYLRTVKVTDGKGEVKIIKGLEAIKGLLQPARNDSLVAGGPVTIKSVPEVREDLKGRVGRVIGKVNDQSTFGGKAMKHTWRILLGSSRDGKGHIICEVREEYLKPMSSAIGEEHIIDAIENRGDGMKGEPKVGMRVRVRGRHGRIIHSRPGDSKESDVVQIELDDGHKMELEAKEVKTWARITSIGTDAGTRSVVWPPAIGQVVVWRHDVPGDRGLGTKTPGIVVEMLFDDEASSKVPSEIHIVDGEGDIHREVHLEHLVPCLTGELTKEAKVKVVRAFIMTSRIDEYAHLSDVDVDNGERTSAEGLGVRWPPSMGDRVLHNGSDCVVTGMTENGINARTTTQVARSSDGLQTLDVHRHDMSPVLLKEEEAAPYRKSTAAGMSKGGKGRHYKHMGASRWVGYIMHAALVWHAIFGHAAMGRIKKTLGATLGGGIAGNWPEEVGPCQGCDASKPRNRWMSRKVTVRPREPWELVALDHPGVNKGKGRGLPITPEGGTTPHTSIECFSGYVFFHELKDHSGAEVARVIGDLADTAYSTSRKSIAVFNADGAKCYTQGVVPRLVAHLGGTMTYSHAYSSNGNSRVERCISTIYKMARKLLAWAKMPMALWGYACRWAAYINNILVGTEGDVTPHELLYGSPPVLTDLRVWGSLGCFTNVSKSLRAACKLQPTSRYGYFMGNAPQRRGVTMIHTRIDDRRKGKVAGVTSQTRDAIIWNLTEARRECPADLRHLLGPAEDEANALDSLRANPTRIDPGGEQQEWSAASPTLPARFSGEPDICDARHFEGKAICRVSLTGKPPTCGNVLGVRHNSHEDGTMVDESQPPGRVLYGVEWREADGSGKREYLEWPEMAPLLTQGHLVPAVNGNEAGENEALMIGPDEVGNGMECLTCAEGHPMVAKCATQELKCDECPTLTNGGEVIRKNDVIMTCHKGCDYDVCMSCTRLITRGEQPLRELENEEIGDDEGGGAAFKENDRVLIQWDQEQFSGVVVKLVTAGVKVKFDIDDTTTVIKYEDSATYLSHSGQGEEKGADVYAIGVTSDEMCRKRGEDVTVRLREVSSRIDSGATPGVASTSRSSSSAQSVGADDAALPWMKQGEGSKVLEDRLTEETSKYLELVSGDYTELACWKQAEEGGNAVIILHQFSQSKSCARPNVMGNNSTWKAWLPWIEKQSPNISEAGTCTCLEGDHGKRDEPAIVRVTTDEGRRASLKNRGEQWQAGLVDLLHSRNTVGDRHILADTDVYLGVGVGCNSAAGRWYEHFMPAAAVFAREANEKYRAKVHIVRDNSTPDAWYREGRFAPRDELWTSTLQALELSTSSEVGTGGAHYQSRREGLPSVERLLSSICDEGRDIFDVACGVADPSDYDGMYGATESESDCRKLGLDDGVEGDDETGERIGAPVRFAVDERDHHSMKAGGRGNCNTPMAYYDPLSKECMIGERMVREVGLEDDIQDVHARQQRIARDLEADLNRSDGKDSDRPEGEKFIPTVGVGLGEDVTSTYESIRAWNMCLGERAALDVLLKAEEAEPSIRDALRGPVRYAWLQSYIAEIRTQVSQGVFVLIRREDAPKGGNIMRSGIRCLVKWQHHPVHGYSPYRLKTRFVAGGDSQIHGVDFTMTSSPTPRPASIRTMFSRGTEEGFVMRTCDISGAFCNSPVEYEGMCMEMPLYLAPDDSAAHPGGPPPRRRGHTGQGRGPWSAAQKSVSPTTLPTPRWDPIGEAAACKSNAGRRRPGHSDYCLRLEKMVYGTKQASRCWFTMWCHHMVSEGFQVSSGDECVFYKFDDQTGEGLVVATHVDDSLVLATSDEVYQEFYRRVRLKFEATDEGEVGWFLGLKIDWGPGEKSVTLSQAALCEAMHTELGEHRSKKVSTPMIENSHLVAGGTIFQVDPEEVVGPDEGLSEDQQLWKDLTRALAHGGMMAGSKDDPVANMTRMERAAVAEYPYRRVLGMALHLVSWTRPDIAFVVSGLARYGDPSKCTWRHCQALSRLTMYLYGTRNMGITYTGGLGVKGDPQVRGYVDADHGGNPETRKSMTGFVIMARGAAISWTASRQRIVAQSSYESELIATRHVTAEFMAIEKDYYAIEQRAAPTPFKLGCDNQSVVSVANGGGSVSKRKHVATRYFLILEAVKEDRIVMVKVNTDDNPSDIMTKSLGVDKFHKFRDIIMGRKGNSGDAVEMGILA